MVEKLVRKPFAVARHRSTVFGPHLDKYLGTLERLGDSPVVLRRDLFMITRFGEYLARRRVERVSDITQDEVAAFLKREKTRLRKCSQAPTRLLTDATRIIEGFLQDLDVLMPVAMDAETAVSVMTDFYRWLEVDRGLQPITIEGYRYFLDQLLRHLGSDGSRQFLSKLTADQIDAFIISSGRTRGRKSISQACSAIRALLRIPFATIPSSGLCRVMPDTQGPRRWCSTLRRALHYP